MSAQYEASERPERLQEALRQIANWLLEAVSAEPGWSELVLDIKPLAGSTVVRITEQRGDESFVGSIGPLSPDSAVLPHIRALQHAAYDEAEGSWLTASVTVAAEGWPNPSYRLGAVYNRAEDPQDWGGEGRLTASELRQHLKDFPRAEEYLPEWVLERIAGRREAKRVIKDGETEVPNQYLVTALFQFSAETPQKLNHSVSRVLRTLLGGDVLLDITGSQLVAQGNSPVGPKSEIKNRVIRLANGMQALCAFSSTDHARAGTEEEPVLLREPGIKVLLDFLANESYDLIVLDPRSEHECFIEKPQAEWALSVPRNDGVKQALLKSNFDQLQSALLAPGSVLNVGVHSHDPYTPIFAPAEGEEEPDTIMFFTSATEVSALDPQLNVQTLPTIDALKLAEAVGARKVRLNALNPSATLSMGQVQDLLKRLEAAQKALS